MIIDGKNNDQLVPEDDLEIVVEGEKKPQTAAQPADTDDDAIAALRKSAQEGQAAAAKAEQDRATAIRERDEARARHMAAVNARVQAEESSINSSISAWQTDVASLNKEYRAALEANNIDKATEINDKLVEARIELRIANGRKADLTAWKEDQVKRAEAAERQQAAASNQDPLANYTDRTRQWIEAHKDSAGRPLFLTDKRFQQRATGAHNLALADGLQPDTDDYFDFVERTMGLKQTDEDEDNTPPARARPSATSTAAPPSRGSNNGTARAQGQGRQTVRLTQAERDLAVTLSSLGNTPEERLRNYAINKQKIAQEAKGTA